MGRGDGRGCRCQRPEGHGGVSESVGGMSWLGLVREASVVVASGRGGRVSGNVCGWESCQILAYMPWPVKQKRGAATYLLSRRSSRLSSRRSSLRSSRLSKSLSRSQSLLGGDLALPSNLSSLRIGGDLALPSNLSSLLGGDLARPSNRSSLPIGGGDLLLDKLLLMGPGLRLLIPICPGGGDLDLDLLGPSPLLGPPPNGERDRRRGT